MKPVVGLTGGIACGKTTVASIFGELGIPVIDADDLAREVVEPGTPGLARVVAEFGEDVLDDAGRLDRKRLADVVFDDDDARKKLNAILHPLIGAAGATHIGELQRHPAPYILYEAALLVETGSYKAFGALVVVSADPRVQKQRLAERDGFSDEEAEARIAAQLPLSEKEAVADYVVANDGMLAETQGRVAEVHAALVARFEARER
ncbi:MAG: dephospho-CoA kinase [Myxococcota bacterium]